MLVYLSLQARAYLRLLHDLLQQGQLSAIIIRSAQDLADLSEGEALGRSMFEQKAGDLHVTQADWSDLDPGSFYHLDIRINVQSHDVLQGLLAERFICLIKSEPDQVKRLNRQGVWKAEAVVNRHQLVVVVLVLSDQDVATVTVQVQNAQIQNCDFVNLVN